MTATIAYLDTSAALKLLIAEQESEALAGALAGLPARISSVLLEVELRCVARRRAIDVQRADALLSGIDLLPFTDPIRARAGGPFEVAQRTGDAIHIATALDFGAPDLVLVSYDRPQIAAAAGAGLLCESPGA